MAMPAARQEEAGETTGEADTVMAEDTQAFYRNTEKQKKLEAKCPRPPPSGIKKPREVNSSLCLRQWGHVILSLLDIFLVVCGGMEIKHPI